MTQTEISNNLFSAIDIIVNKKLAEAEFDRTVLVTVIKACEGYKHKYLVSFQGAKFEAYAINDFKYEKDMVAYMLIPRNKMDQDKFLLGPITYYYKEIKEE